MSTEPTPSIEALVRAFDRMNADVQLMYLDYLSDRTEYADQLVDGLRAAALAHGEYLSETEGCDADDIAGSLICTGAFTRDAMARHNAMRECTIRSALDGQVRQDAIKAAMAARKDAA